MPGDFPTVAIYGTGGHAKIVKEILDLKQIPVFGFLDHDPDKKGTRFLDRPVLGSEEILNSEKIPFDAVVIAVGKGKIRKHLCSLFRSKKIHLLSAVHPSAIISPTVKMGGGIIICAGVVISPGSIIGECAIINTGAVVDHDCKISPFTQIAPGTVVCGKVSIGELTFIGAGTTIIQNKKIGNNSIIGAGSVIISDIPSNVLVVGVPGKIKRTLNF